MLAIREINGDVTFQLEPGDGEILEGFQTQVQQSVDHEVLGNLLDYFGFLGNARYMPIQPEDIGALTDAPMFTDELAYSDDGQRLVTGSVWWYPEYEAKSFSDVLLAKGQVTFTMARN